MNKIKKIPTKRIKELEQTKRKVRLTFLIAFMCLAQSVMAQSNQITITPKSEPLPVSEDVPDSTDWTPEGLKDVQPTVEVKVPVETEPIKVKAIEKTVHSKNWYKEFIYQHESGGEPCKINGGDVNCEYTGKRACGLGQSLPCSNLTSVCNLEDVSCQEVFWENYMINRYGTWEKAYKFWIANKWW